MIHFASCKHLLQSHFDPRNFVEAVEFNGVILLRFISALILLILILKNRHRAGRGDGKRAILLVLPSYYPIIITAIIYYFTSAMLHIFVVYYAKYIVLISIDVGVQHAMSEGLTFFLMQHGAGLHAFKRGLLCALTFGVVTFFNFYLMFRAFNDRDNVEISRHTFFIHMIFSSFLISLYTLLILLPTQWLYRRPAFYNYAKYCLVQNFFWLIASTLIYVDHEIGFCTVLSGKVFFISIFHPMAFVYALAKDSEVSQTRHFVHF